MKALHKARKDVAILAVNIAVNDSKRRASRYRDHFMLPFPVIYDEAHEITKAYRVRGTPTNVIIDKDGVIRYSGISRPEDLDAVLGPRSRADQPASGDLSSAG